MDEVQRIQRVADKLVQAGLEAGTLFRFRIASESMRPTLQLGDEVIVQQVDWRRLRVGDIVLCDTGRMIVAHRLLAVQRRNGVPLLLTKGDATWNFDAPHTLHSYRGKVQRVERAGRGVDCNRIGLVAHARVRAWLSFTQARLTQLYRKLKRRRGWMALLLMALLLFSTTHALAAVTISAFSAKGGNNQITLNWSTATELKNFRFDIERSPDQNAWSKIGSLDSQSQCIQSLSTLNYSYPDTNLPAATKYYYRLKMIGSPCGDPDTYYDQVVNATTNGVSPSASVTPTPSSTPLPTNTPTRTNTLNPPTATNTARPTSTATNTPIPPTTTASATPANSATPTAPPSTATLAASATTASTATPTARAAYPLPTLNATATVALPTTDAGSPTPTETTAAASAATVVAIIVPTDVPSQPSDNNSQGNTPSTTGDDNMPSTSPNAASTPSTTSVDAATSAAQDGASAVPLVAGAVAIALLGGVGWFVWRRRLPHALASNVPPPTDEQ